MCIKLKTGLRHAQEAHQNGGSIVVYDSKIQDNQCSQPHGTLPLQEYTECDRIPLPLREKGIVILALWNASKSRTRRVRRVTPSYQLSYLRSEASTIKPKLSRASAAKLPHASTVEHPNSAATTRIRRAGEVLPPFCKSIAPTSDTTFSQSSI